MAGKRRALVLNGQKSIFVPLVLLGDRDVEKSTFWNPELQPLFDVVEKEGPFNEVMVAEQSRGNAAFQYDTLIERGHPGSLTFVVCRIPKEGETESFGPITSIFKGLGDALVLPGEDWGTCLPHEEEDDGWKPPEYGVRRGAADNYAWRMVDHNAPFDLVYVRNIVGRKGPGDFTGVKNALATAAGLAARGAPVIAYDDRWPQSVYSEALVPKDLLTLEKTDLLREGRLVAYMRKK